MTIAAAEPLTWQECVRRAAQNNADLKAAQATLQSSQYQVKAAASGYFPQLNGSLGYSYGKNVGDVAASDHSAYTANLTLSQNLFRGFQDQNLLRQAQANRDLSQANYDLVKAKVSYELKAAYEGMCYAQDYLTLAQEIVGRREENLRLVQLRYESGRENKGSALLSRAYLGQARIDRLQAQDLIKVAQAQLAKVLGLGDAEAIALADRIPTRQPSPSLDLKTFVPQVPEYRLSLAQESASRYALEIARASFYPSLDLSGILGTHSSTFFPDDGRWQFGLTLSFPFFNGGKDYYSAKNASASLSAATFNRHSLERQLLAKLTQTASAYLEAVEQEKVSQDFMEAARVREQIARAKYNNGLLSFDDFDIIENDLIARQKSAVQSRRDRVIAEAVFEQASGQGVLP